MIRELRSEDRAGVIALVQATGNFSDDEVAIAKELIDICVEQPDQKDYYAYVAVAEEDSKVASKDAMEDAEKPRVTGFLLLGPTPATLGTYDMYWIAVDPRYQGQGIAQALDRYAEEFVRSRNGYWLIAETSSQPSYERTRAFYIKQRYQLLTRIADYYKPSDDLMVFGKRLDT